MAIDIFKQQSECCVLGIVEYDDAKLSEYADLLLSIPWANETSICQTQSFSNLYLVCILTAALLKDDKCLLSDISDYISSFNSLSKHTENFIKDFFADHAYLTGLITLGNGKLFGVMCEGAYITVEMAQSPAHFFYTLEFRHGPIVLLDETYLVVLCSHSYQNELEENLIADIQKKGAKVLVIASENNLKNVNFILTPGKKYATEVLGLYASFVLQAIAYQKAIIMEVNPDKPKDLVAWIAI
ncbi:MAG: SIS domain-containing protein [Chitinophagaceae bacterium]|nr:SIS domain-containing protein [Chitinophagaceae bacterium]